MQEALERAAYGEIRARIAASDARAAIHDLSTPFAPGESVFVDPVHFGDRGQQVVADAMFGPILALVRDHPRAPGTSACGG